MDDLTLLEKTLDHYIEKLEIEETNTTGEYRIYTTLEVLAMLYAIRDYK